MTNQLNDYQHLFTTDLNELIEADEDSINFIEQSHPGDLLIEEVNEGNERFNLWKNLESNGGGLEIEAYNRQNNYHWETIFNSNDNLEY